MIGRNILVFPPKGSHGRFGLAPVRTLEGYFEFSSAETIFAFLPPGWLRVPPATQRELRPAS